MPEGPEVWMLSKVINKFYNFEKTISYGKHLIIKDIKETWSFGLNGKANVSSYNELVKIDLGWINGDIIKYDDDYRETIKELGLDWMTASKEELEKEKNKLLEKLKTISDYEILSTKDKYNLICNDIDDLIFKNPTIKSESLFKQLQRIKQNIVLIVCASNNNEFTRENILESQSSKYNM